MDTYKLVLVGDGEVGKTTWVKKLLTQEFELNYVATLGVEVHPIILEDVRFNVWDTAGQKKFEGLKDGYYIQANCGMVCFDLTSRITLEHAIQWAQDLDRYTPNIVLVGFKGDLEKEVTQEEINFVKEALQCPYFEISTKNGTNMEAPLNYFKLILASSTISTL